MAVKSPRVLIVDDEKDIVDVLKRGLSLKGIDVDAFSDPLEALAEFRPGRYDFVVMDIRMPRMNGFDLYRAIRSQDANVRVYFLSAYDNLQNEVNAMLSADALVGFLRKPISYSELAKLLLSETRMPDLADH
jgi:DNA-binding response OmpR family regulator